MRHLFIASLLLLLAAVLPATASATLRDATYCVDYLVDYTDGSTGDFYTGSDGPARGVMLEFTRTGAAAATFFTDWNGADPGCLDVDIDDAYSWTVKIVAYALVNNNYVRVLAGGGDPVKITWLTGHTPADNVTYQTDLGPSPTSNVMGVASYSLYRSNAGLYAEIFDFVFDECITQAEADVDEEDDLEYLDTSCFRPDLGEIRITDGHEDYKFIITHEMGHAVSDFANDGDGLDFDYEANGGDCGPFYADESHAMPTKEFSSAAAVEGIAHFWSVLAMNDDSQDAGCIMEKHYNPDWLQSGSDGQAEDASIFSCSGAIFVDSVLVVDTFDYYGQFCDGSGAQTNRSTEYDWVRALWDERTKGLFTTAQIYDIWDSANPHTWTVNGTGSGGNFPAARMSGAAYGIGGSGWEVTWDTWAGNNGIAR